MPGPQSSTGKGTTGQREAARWAILSIPRYAAAEAAAPSPAEEAAVDEEGSTQNKGHTTLVEPLSTPFRFLSADQRPAVVRL